MRATVAIGTTAGTPEARRRAASVGVVIVIAGTLLVDEVLTLAAPAHPGSAQRALGRMRTGGGQVWHTARAARTAGAQVVVVGRRGADADGVELASALADDGVDVRLSDVGSSRRALVLDAPPHERAIVSIAPDDDERPLGALSLPNATRRLHLDGYALDDLAGDALVTLARTAAAQGIPISLEPPSIGGMAARLTRLASLPPLSVLVGRPDEVAAAAGVLASAATVVVSHDGPRPVRWQQGSDAWEHPAPEPSTFGPTLGAGDRFTGGLLAALDAGRRPAECLAAGVAAAAAH